MEHTLPRLPYGQDALAPYIPLETMQYHDAKHHQAHADKLNKLISDTEYADLPLEAIIQQAPSRAHFQQRGPGMESCILLAEHEARWRRFSHRCAGRRDGRDLAFRRGVA